MDNMWILCLPIIIVLVIGVILIYYISSKKYLLASFPNKEVNSFRNESIQKFAEQGFKIDDKGDKLHLENGTMTAADLIFAQNGNQVEIYRQNSATVVAWILIIVGAIFFLILALIIGIISDSNSKNFAENTILPLLQERLYHEQRLCPSCMHEIPFDANICPYCGRKFDSFI